jgi:hypothetical protein
MALNPTTDLDRFQANLDDSMDRYRRVFEALDSSPDKTDLRKGIAVDAVFRLGAEWENFQHRWQIAAISQDPAKLIAKTKDAAQRKVDEVDEVARNLFGVTLSRTLSSNALTREQIETLLDPRQRNVTFSNVGHWLKESKKYLSPDYLRRVQRLDTDVEDSCVVDLLKAIRNAIAHGSQTATTQMNEAVRARIDNVGIDGAANTPLIRPSYRIRDIGTYLHGWPETVKRNAAETTRVALIHKRMRDISEELR